MAEICVETAEFCKFIIPNSSPPISFHCLCERLGLIPVYFPTHSGDNGTLVKHSIPHGRISADSDTQAT
jgi:hypothetical protein